MAKLTLALAINYLATFGSSDELSDTFHSSVGDIFQLTFGLLDDLDDYGDDYDHHEKINYKPLRFDFPEKLQFETKGWALNSWDKWVRNDQEERITIQASDMAKQAYKTHSDLDSLRSLDGDATIVELEAFGHKTEIDGNSYGFVAIVQDTRTDEIYAAVAFRGTQGSLTGMDWMADFDCVREDGIHRGFKIRVEENIDIWASHLRKFKNRYDFREVVFTGHSLGAAEASVSAVLLDDKMRDDSDFDLGNVDLNVINFASPRPGNEAFMKRHKKAVARFRRFINPGDLVTNMPPKVIWDNGYTHVDDGIIFYCGAIPGTGCTGARFDISDLSGTGGLGSIRYAEAITASLAGGALNQGTHSHSMELYHTRMLKCSTHFQS